MESSNLEGAAEGLESLPPPPPVIPPNVVPVQAEPKETHEPRVPMARLNYGTKGYKLPLLTNHFKVDVHKSEGYFFHYNVALFYEDGRPVEAKGIGRKVLDKVQETCDSELEGKSFAYDGEKSLFTFGSLPGNKLEFSVVLDELSSNRTSRGSNDGSPGGVEIDCKRSRHYYKRKTFKVEIHYSAQISMQAIADALSGQESHGFQEALRVLNIILRQNASKHGCLLLRQSFFHDNPKNFAYLGDGVLRCQGFHSSFRAIQGGLSLNVDVSSTIIVKPGPVLDFLTMSQNLNDPYEIDWIEAMGMLKNLRIRANNIEFKITGLSDKSCREQTFLLKQRNGRDGDGEVQLVEITVYDYFVNHKHIQLCLSANMPCINVGKPKHPCYFPVELCTLVSLQRYTKALSNFQRSTLVAKSWQKPQEQMQILNEALRSSKYEADQMLLSSGISISTEFTQLEGRVLSTPKLRAGGGVGFFPQNGWWNFNNKKLVEPMNILRWAVVNFSASCDIRGLCNKLIKCGEMKGILINPPHQVFKEIPQHSCETAPVRVEKMFDMIQSGLPDSPQFLLCILSERKKSEIYGPWKRKCLAEHGIVTQCIAPASIVTDLYLTNVLLKINAKLGGINSLLAIEHSPSIPMVSERPTLILGMDVSHGSPGRSDVPSIAAVVSSRCWPLISRYRASVRTQSPKVEMIASLFMPGSDKEDHGIIRELLLDFYTSSGKRKPEQIIIFRDGVSESQFNQVLNIELDQIHEACKLLDKEWSPKFTLIVAQKKHHTKFFQSSGNPENVPPGTVIDRKVCHPKNNDFYLCAHFGMLGTTRPTHYHVLHDEVGFSANDLQELVHSLSYVYQGSTSAISVVAPIRYAHKAASQMAQFIKFDEMSDTSSGQGGVTSVGGVPVPELPRLHENVTNSMFFC